MINRCLIFVAIFFAGCLTSLAIVSIMTPAQEYSTEEQEASPSRECFIGNPFLEEPIEKQSPYDWVKQDQIHVYEDKVVIDISNPEWARFTDTNSMDPVIDASSNAIEIEPDSMDDVHVGDVISYKSKYTDGIIIHRVIEIGNDGEWFCRVKGDNNPSADPGKIRFEQIQRVVVAVIY